MDNEEKRRTPFWCTAILLQMKPNYFFAYFFGDGGGERRAKNPMNIKRTPTTLTTNTSDIVLNSSPLGEKLYKTIPTTAEIAPSATVIFGFFTSTLL